MKKYLFLFLLLFPCALQGKVVTPDSAREIAAEYFAGLPQTRSGGEIRLLWDGRTVTRGLITDPPFYVFGRDSGGFIIVAGEDCCRPVLGYSDRNVFSAERMPAHLSGWFEGLAGMIREAREKGIEPSEQIRKEWIRVRSEVRGQQTTIVELKTAQWNQGFPYNLMIPSIDGQHCLTGCGTTATAIAMRCLKWPRKGEGTLPNYSYQTESGTINQSGHTLGHVYSWDKMPLTNISSENMDIAQLMLDVGIMNKCQFGIKASGTYTNLIPPAMATYMDYHRSIRVHDRDDYNSEEWERMIRKELDEGRPIIYQGYKNDEGGHLWIVDGYSAEGYFDMNWGWGGYNNGYFLLTPMSETGGYTTSHAAIFPIKPASPDDPFRNEDYLRVENYQWSWSYEKEVPMDFSLCVWNKHWGYTDMLTLRAALTDSNGKIKQWVSDPIRYEFQGYGGLWVRGAGLLPDDLKPEDRIQVFLEKEGEWIPLPYNEKGIITFNCDVPIEECSTLSYHVTTTGKTLTVETNPLYYVEMSSRNPNGRNFYSKGMGRIELGNFDHWGYSIHVTIRNLTESKEFDIIQRKSN